MSAFGMTAASIRRQLEEMGVPAHRAAVAAQTYGADTARLSPAQKAANRKARALRDAAFRREFRAWCRANDLPLPVFEFRFHPVRQWRADIAWPDPDCGGVLLEIDGGGYQHGRHHRPAGFAEDQLKRNAAIELGFQPLHVTPQTLYSASTLSSLRALLTNTTTETPTSP